MQGKGTAKYLEEKIRNTQLLWLNNVKMPKVLKGVR